MMKECLGIGEKPQIYDEALCLQRYKNPIFLPKCDDKI